MKFVLTASAERDIRTILQQTLTMFGPTQVAAYANIIRQGITLVTEDPYRAGSSDRGALAKGVRQFHLKLATPRGGGASHHLYYVTGRLQDGSEGIIIVRILHKRMDPRLRVARAAKGIPSSTGERPA
jgi:toxin ParE1/3/4